MSWHFSQALVEEYSAANCSDGEQSVPWNMNPMPRLFSSSDKMMGFCNRSQSGMTCEHLTENLGEELLMWFLEGFHVRTSALPEEAKELVGNDQDCGQKWLVSFAKYDPDMRSWKIVRSSLFEDLRLFSGTWPRWGMMQNGECSRLPMLEHDTNVKGCGSWLTPTVFDSHNRPGSAPNNTLTFWVKSFGKAVSRNGQVLNIDSRAKKTILNPCFLELMMGYPIGWTELQELETDKFQQWLDSHGKSSGLDQTKPNHRKIPKKSFKKSSQKGLFDK